MLLMDREWLEPRDFTSLSPTMTVVSQFRLPPGGLVLERTWSGSS